MFRDKKNEFRKIIFKTFTIKKYVYLGNLVFKMVKVQCKI